MLLCHFIVIFPLSLSFSFLFIFCILQRSLDSDSPVSLGGETIGRPQSEESRGYKLQVSSGGVSPVSEPDSTTDALTLLADLALGASGESPALKTNSCHAGPPPRGLPPPEGLVVGGELILIISQEHSYSGTQGLTGGPHQPSPQNVVETSAPSGPQEPLRSTDPQGRNTNSIKEANQSPGNTVAPQYPVAERRKWGSKWTRGVSRAGKTISVTRQWKDQYDFGQDSKYTNEPLVKSVLRSLHGCVD